MVNPDGGGPSLGPRAEPISSHDERRGVSVKTSQVGPGSQQKSKNAPELKALVESLLFVAEGPVTAGQLARALEVKANEVEDVLTTLAEEYRTRGLRLQRDDGRVQIVSAPEAAFYIEQFLGLSTDGHRCPGDAGHDCLSTARHPGRDRSSAWSGLRRRTAYPAHQGVYHPTRTAGTGRSPHNLRHDFPVPVLLRPGEPG
jgi:hypothetical protein